MTDEQTATEIMRTFYDDDGPSMHAAIVRALQAARTPPPGHIIDDAGVVRKVMGTLPMTADGCVVGDAAHLWTNNAGEVNALRADAIGATEFGEDGDFYEAAECYSTREAAEAAKEAQ